MQYLHGTMYTNIVEKAEIVRRFCDRYGKIGAGHMVEFFARGHYQQCIADSARNQLEQFTTEQLVRLWD